MINVRFPSKTEYDILCFSHLRWDFVYQRPQHLLSRFARQRRVFFIEEPIFHEGDPTLEISQREDNLFVVLPKLAGNTDANTVNATLRALIDQMNVDREIEEFIAWYYTPMMTAWTGHLKPRAVVFDCMDELSAFKNAPAELRQREADLLRVADVVFTGGRSLYEAKRTQHPAVHCFPSSIDVQHFARALVSDITPADQLPIGKPRIGFFGVIDERTDLEMLTKIAELRPNYQFVLIGPVVKIDPEALPKKKNIHYLGSKDYKELPDYIAGWDVAMMPFAINESTRFISPTKTPEYLAAGRPVVSTPITDVVRPYGEEGLVTIAEAPKDFANAIDAVMNENASERRERAEQFLAGMSWDITYEAMSDLIDEAIAKRKPATRAARV